MSLHFYFCVMFIGCGLDDADVTSLGEALKFNTALIELDLSCENKMSEI